MNLHQEQDQIVIDYNMLESQDSNKIHLASHPWKINFQNNRSPRKKKKKKL